MILFLLLLLLLLLPYSCLFASSCKLYRFNQRGMKKQKRIRNNNKKKRKKKRKLFDVLIIKALIAMAQFSDSELSFTCNDDEVVGGDGITVTNCKSVAVDMNLSSDRPYCVCA